MLSENKHELFERIAPLRTRYLTVVLENIHHDHNASAVMRTCDCFGIQDLHVIEKSFKYEIQRDIARGSGRWIDLHQYHSGENPTIACLQSLKSKGYQIVATSPKQNAKPISELPIDQSTAVVFGTEWEGISQEVEDMADHFVTIPMYGFTESFNVSVSVALVMQHLRGRLEAQNTPFKISEEEQLEIKIAWATSLLRNGSELLSELENRQLDKLK